jgi:nucleotide-binding universal stress UspA family protein
MMADRIRETSRHFAKQIPHCSLSEEQIQVEIGDPAKEIVHAAHRGVFDLIIMGSHGHGKLEQTMIGSVTQEVIRQSDIPVLVVRLPSAYHYIHHTAPHSSADAPPLAH